MKASKLKLAQMRSPLPLPQRAPTKPVSSDLNVELYDTVMRVKPAGTKMVDILEWGLANFLLLTAPEEAEKLGIRMPSRK